jgi:hypothetical protein
LSATAATPHCHFATKYTAMVDTKNSRPTGGDANTSNTSTEPTPPKATPDTPSASWLDTAQYYWKYGMDDQRLQRLQQCRILERTLQACRDRNVSRPSLEEFPGGIRMIRYFDWRGYEGDDSCQRELHSVWACRGVGLQCGSDVVKLRHCFQEVGSDAVLRDVDESAGNAYETLNERAVCGEWQYQVGQCVARNAAELEARQRLRNSASDTA